MELKELLEYFNTSDTIGENQEAIDLICPGGTEDHDGDQHRIP